MIDDPQKSIRRAVMVAKGLAKKIDQLPGGSRMQAPHPASMIPGVHVMGMDGAQGYADGGSTPAWQRKEGQNPSGGLNSKGRASYHSETGGTLKPPVKAGDNPRRSSFLARMGNMPGPEHDEHGEPTRLLKSLQAWGASSKADARAKAHAIHKTGGGVVSPDDRQKNFKQWFGNSHVVDETGKPKVVYHGTPDVRGILKEGFQPRARGSVFFAAGSRPTADSYADDRRAFDYQNAEPATIPLHLSLQNPMHIDAQGKNWKETEKHVEEAKDKGHDGLIIHNSVDYYNNTKNAKPTTVYAWFHPTQAKSALNGPLISKVDRQPIVGSGPNQGTYNLNDPAIHKAGGGNVEPTDETGFDAWHGTPHTFAPEPGAPLGRFRSDKIGTGEGAQAYGRGMYVGQEGTARGYKENVKDMGAIADLNNRLSSLAKIMHQHEIPNQYRKYRSLEGYKAASEYDDLMDKRTEVHHAPGHLLHVRVRANPEHFLDWDKPISEQHPHVQEALRSLPFADHRFQKDALGREATGATFAPKGKLSTDQFVKAGIPGIRYLDANSRDPDTDQPTHNHVIFDPSIIDIKHRYARGGDVGGGYQDAPFRHIEARSPGWGDTWTPLHEIQGKLKSPISSISDSAANFGDFMSGMAHKASTQGLAPRDLIKAYLMTISSQGRQAVLPKTILKNWPDYPGPTHGKIRPEGAMGEWLASPMGRRYLDAAEQGKVDPEAVQHALKSFNGFGFADSHEGDAMPWAAQNLAPHTKMVSDMIAESVKGRHSSEDWRRWVKKNVNGVGFAKAGFFASMLGRGDQPVPDARQLVLNTPEGSDALTKIGTGNNSAPATLREGEAIDRLAARQRALSLAHPKELAPHYQSLAHHTIWDAAKGTDTTHQDVIDAMRHAASGGLIGGKDEHPVVTIMKHLGMPGIHDDQREHYDRGGGKGLSPNDVMVQNALKRVAAQQANSFTRSGAKLIGKDASFLDRQQQMSEKLTKTPGIPLNEMESTHISKETLNPWKELTPEALYNQKAYIAPFLGDRTPAGTILTHVNGIPLAKPVNQQGGGDFTRSEAAQGDDPAAWGNRDSTARMMFAQIKGQVPEGSPVFGGHVAMGLASADSSHQVAQTLLQLMPHMNIHPDHIEKFDKKMREALPSKGKTPAWPGVMNTDEAERYFKETPGTHASVFAKMMESGEWRKHGFPDVGLARFANTEHRLLNVPNLSTGYAFSGIDTSKPLIRDAPHGHETYSTLIPSSTGYAGGFKYQVPARLMFPKFYSELKPKDKNGKPIDYNSPEGTTMAQRSIMTKTPVQKTDQEWLDNIMQHQEQNPQKWGYKNGGNAVTHALSIARKAIKR